MQVYQSPDGYVFLTNDSFMFVVEPDNSCLLIPQNGAFTLKQVPTNDEFIAALSQKSDTNHLHTNYCLIEHNHDTAYALLAHTHTAPDWSTVANKPATFAPAAHNHDTTYSVISHTHSAPAWSTITNIPTTFTPSAHNHDTAYAAIAHAHTATYLPFVVGASNSAFILNVVDSSFGGFSRGLRSLDLQTQHVNPSQVVSGADSCALGSQNTVSSQFSACIGYHNTHYGACHYSSIVGSNNLTNDLYTFTAGDSCQTTGKYSIAVGNSCLSSGIYSVSLGAFADTRFIKGYFGFCSGAAAFQSGELILKAQTVSASVVVATSDGAAISASNTLSLPNNSSLIFSILCIAKTASFAAVANFKAFEVKGVLSRGTGVATTIVSLNAVSVIGAGSLGCFLTVTANTTFGGLSINCTGVASTTINWNATVTTAEIIGL